VLGLRGIVILQKGLGFGDELFGPDCKNVSLAVREVEALAAGKVEGGYNDGAAGSDDCILRGFQVLRVEDDEGSGLALGLRWVALAKSAVDTGLIASEADVVGAVVLEVPAKGALI